MFKLLVEKFKRHGWLGIIHIQVLGMAKKELKQSWKSILICSLLPKQLMNKRSEDVLSYSESRNYPTWWCQKTSMIKCCLPRQEEESWNCFSKGQCPLRMNRWQSFQLCWKERTPCHLESHDFKKRLHAILSEGKKFSEFRGSQQLHSSHAEN